GIRVFAVTGVQTCALPILGIREGGEVSPRSDGLLGILYVGAEDRARTVRFASHVLDDVWIAGSLQTNERFLRELLGHPWVKEGSSAERRVGRQRRAGGGEA